MNKVIIIIAQRTVILICLLALCGCPGKKEAASPYKVIDSGIWITPGPEGKVFWLDNDRAVFITYTTLKPGGNAKALTIWSPKTGKIEQPFQAIAIKCAQDGVIAFMAKNDTEERHLYRGTMDNLLDITYTDRPVWFDEYFDCNWKQIPTTKPPYFLKLKDDNWLEIVKKESGNRLEKGEMYYYEKRDKPPVKLPVTEVGSSGLYLMRHQKIEKILLGQVGGVSISPDGCWALFSHTRNIQENYSKEPPYRTVKAINFCEGSSNK